MEKNGLKVHVLVYIIMLFVAFSEDLVIKDPMTLSVS